MQTGKRHFADRKKTFCRQEKDILQTGKDMCGRQGLERHVQRQETRVETKKRHWWRRKGSCVELRENIIASPGEHREDEKERLEIGKDM